MPSDAVVIAVLKAVLVTLLISAGSLTIFVVAFIIWIKRRTKNGVYAVMVEPNGEVTTKLVKLNSDGMFILKGKSVEEEESYMFDPKQGLWIRYPPLAPEWLRETVPMAVYVRTNPEPVSLFENQKKSAITASILRAIQDKAMYQQTWREAKEAVGVKAAVRQQPLMLFLLLLTLLTAAAGAYFGFTALQQIDTVMRLLKGGG